REATGPLAPYFRKLAGDPDEETLAKLTPLPDSEKPDRERVPSALHQAWSDYLARFTVYYGLNDQQRGEAARVLEESEGNAVGWLVEQKKGRKKRRGRKNEKSPPRRERLQGHGESARPYRGV